MRSLGRHGWGLLTVTVILVAAVGVAGVRAQTQEPPSGIRVRGQGVVTALPDVASVSLTASVRRPTPGEAFDEVSVRIAQLHDVLRANGVAERDVQTRGLSLAQEFAPTAPPSPGVAPQPPVLLGWRARQSITIKLRDFPRVGQTITAAVNVLGESAELQSISFTIEDIDLLIDRARELAAANAREKAELLAARLGGRLGRLVYATEISAPAPGAVSAQPTPVRTAAPIASPAAQRPEASIPVAPGEQTVTVTIEAIYALE